uniref:Coiled-coil domain-containing protein 12 n=1 Tax=Parascaris univalens TaxID=6257 RepID=A0A915B9A8_PARUN
MFQLTAFMTVKSFRVNLSSIANQPFIGDTHLAIIFYCLNDREMLIKYIINT